MFGGMRYGEMTSNAAESFNNWIKEARNLPITQMVDTIRTQLMRQMSARRDQANKWKELICPTFETRLMDSFNDSRSWQVSRSWQSVHIVTQAVAEKQPPSPMQHNISPPSRVKHIKEKDRKEHRLPDFQYPDLPGQKQSHPVEMVEDVEKHPPAKQPKKLSLTNKFKVWSKMSKQDKQKVQALQKSGGDELLVWKGDSKATHVYFDDIVNLIKEESIHNNLIDAYAKLLHEQQEVVNPTSDEASFIFTSMCLKVIREYYPRKRSKHIDAHVKNYQGERYLLFSLHHEYHWTIVVYDAKDNLWRHYNSLRSRTSIHDPYIDQAQEVRKYIEHVVSVIGESSPLYTKLVGQNPAQPIKSVDVCPQQVDCRPAVCYIMRAHIYHEKIVGNLSSSEWCGLRDLLVHSCLNHKKSELH
ncbi:unnamed protein product [Camellia sinensis]